MKSVYDDKAYALAFERELALRAKHAQLVAEADALRARLASWQPGQPGGESALERALQAVDGPGLARPADEALQSLRAEYGSMLLRIAAIERGIPQAMALLQAEHRRVTVARRNEPDVQRVLAHAAKTGRAMLAAIEEVRTLGNQIGVAGFGLGEGNDYGGMLPDEPMHDIETWLDRIESMVLAPTRKAQEGSESLV